MSNLVTIKDIFKDYLFIYLERVGAHMSWGGRGKGKERILSRLALLTEPNAGLNPRTPRS